MAFVVAIRIEKMMKLVSTIILLSVFHVTVLGQGNKIRIADQFLISANGSFNNLDNVKFRSGFGAGMYRTFLQGKLISCNLGIEWNRTREFHTSVLIGHFGNYENLTYSKNSVSFPLNFRIHAGNSSKWFFETGGLYDWVISSKQQGLVHTYVPDSNWQPQERYFEVDESAGLINAFGASISIGMKIPGNKFDGVVKLNFKHIFPDGDFIKYRVLRRTIHLHAGIAFE